MSGPHKNIEEYGMTAEEELKESGENKVALIYSCPGKL